jgi:hypothetical protein
MSRATAEKHARKYLMVVKDIYPEISQEFEEIENDKAARSEVRMDRFSGKLNKAIRLLKQVDSQELREIASEEVVNNVEAKINSLYDDLLYMQRRIMGYEYAENLEVPLTRYLKNAAGNPENYKKWAKHPEELTKKFMEMLLHPDNVETYKNQIKRMALGTMSQKEFNKIFQAAKHKMMPLPEYNFKSFKDYKGSNRTTSKPIQYKP